VDGVVLEERVAVVLSLTSTLGLKTAVDLVDNIGNVSYSFLSEMLESVAAGCTSEDPVELIFGEIASVESFVEITPLVVAEGLLGGDQLAHFAGNTGFVVSGQLGDAGHPVKSAATGRSVVSRRGVDGVILEERVAVVLSLTGTLRFQTTVDLVDDVRDVANSLLAEMLEWVTSDELVDLVLQESTFVQSGVEIAPLVVAEGLSGGDQLADFARNTGFVVSGQLGDAGHLVRRTAGRGVVATGSVDGVVLGEGVAVVLGLTGTLRFKTTVDLVDNVGDVADGFLSEVLEGVATGSAGVDPVVDKVALVDCIVSGASDSSTGESDGDGDSGELNFSDHDYYRERSGRLSEEKKLKFVERMFR